MTTGRIFEAPHLLGFEDLLALAERAQRVGDGYPPFNVEVIQTGFRITLTVAGFAPEDLSVTQNGRELTIEGGRPQSDADRTYLHRGLALRRFRRVFALADGLEAGEVTLSRGLLHISIDRPTPSAPRVLPIKVQD
jgi:HSP20 family molecular chaperone IbpA